MGDTPPVVLTKDDAERTVRLAKVERLNFDKSQLVPAYGQEQCAVAGIADFYCICTHKPSDFLKSGCRATSVSIRAHEPTGPLREIRRRLYWLDRRRGIVVVEKRSLEPNMLLGQRSTTLAVVSHEYAQVLVRQEQQLTTHRGKITFMPKRSLAVVAHIGEAVSHAQESRIRRVQGAVHLLGGAFFQDARPGDVCVAVAAILQVRDHETRHVRDAGLVCAGRPQRRLSGVIGECLESAIFIRVSDGCLC